MVTAVGKVVGYAVANRIGDGIDMVYTGPIEDTSKDAEKYASEPGDFVVAVCEVGE